jgi:hypothetical protein
MFFYKLKKFFDMIHVPFNLKKDLLHDPRVFFRINFLETGHSIIFLMTFYMVIMFGYIAFTFFQRVSFFKNLYGQQVVSVLGMQVSFKSSDMVYKYSDSLWHSLYVLNNFMQTYDHKS